MLGRVSKLLKIVSLLVMASSLGGCDLWIVNPEFALRTSVGLESADNGEEVFHIVKDSIEVRIVGHHARDESRFWLITRLSPTKRWAQFRISVKNLKESDLNVFSPVCTLMARETVHPRVPERGKGEILHPETSFEFQAEFSDIPNLNEDEPLLLTCTILVGEHNKPLTIESRWVMALVY